MTTSRTIRPRSAPNFSWMGIIRASNRKPTPRNMTQLSSHSSQLEEILPAAMAAPVNTTERPHAARQITMPVTYLLVTYILLVMGSVNRNVLP